MGEVVYLSKKQILEADDIPIDDLEVPEWGGMIRMRGLTGEQRDDYETTIMQQNEEGQWSSTKEALQNARAKLVVLTIIDAEGKLVFDQKDVEALGKKSAVALNRVWNKARELSGLVEGDLEKLVGNSEADQSDDSSSDSH